MDKTVIAKPWTLPIIILSGLSASYAIPWNHGPEVSLFRFIFLISPFLIQAGLSAVTAVFAFLGKKAWLGLLSSLLIIALINLSGALFKLWGFAMPGLPIFLLFVTTFALIGAIIWGRKDLAATSLLETNPFQSTEIPKNSDW
jgi:hypothetical protein